MTVTEHRPRSRSVQWSRLTPRSRSIVQQVGIRLAAGYSYDEITVMLEQNRDKLEAIGLPRGRITKGWVQARMREVRQEIAAMD